MCTRQDGPFMIRVGCTDSWDGLILAFMKFHLVSFEASIALFCSVSFRCRRWMSRTNFTFASFHVSVREIDITLLLRMLSEILLHEFGPASRTSAPLFYRSGSLSKNAFSYPFFQLQHKIQNIYSFVRVIAERFVERIFATKAISSPDYSSWISTRRFLSHGRSRGAFCKPPLYADDGECSDITKASRFLYLEFRVF